jgi:hypothetical protein
MHVAVSHLHVAFVDISSGHFMATISRTMQAMSFMIMMSDRLNRGWSVAVMRGSVQSIQEIDQVIRFGR